MRERIMDESAAGVSHAPASRRWFKAALLLTAPGALAALAFGLTWFTRISTHCGVVRIYEQALGAGVLFGWGVVTAVAIATARFADRHQRQAGPVALALSLLCTAGAITALIRLGGFWNCARAIPPV